MLNGISVGLGNIGADDDDGVGRQVKEYASEPRPEIPCSLWNACQMRWPETAVPSRIVGGDSKQCLPARIGCLTDDPAAVLPIPARCRHIADVRGKPRFDTARARQCDHDDQPSHGVMCPRKNIGQEFRSRCL